MCVYARTVFDCQHEIWGRRVKICAAGQGFEDGTLVDFCTTKTPHGLHTIKLARKCSSCTQLMEKLSAARTKLAGCREQFEKKWKTSDNLVAVEKWLNNAGSVGAPADVASPDKQDKEVVKSDDGWIRAEDVEEPSGSPDPTQDEAGSGPNDEEEIIPVDFDKSSETGSSRSDEVAHYTIGSCSNIANQTKVEDVAASKILGEAAPTKEPEQTPDTQQKGPKMVPRSRLAVPVSKLPRLSTPPKVVSKLPRPQFQSKIVKPISRS